MSILKHNRVISPLFSQLSTKTVSLVFNHPLHLLSTPSNFTKVRLIPEPSLQLPCRFKSKKKKSQSASLSESDTDEEKEDDAWDQAITDKTSKLLNVHVSSLRVDVLIKAGLGIARNKVETLFYDNKIRLNGRSLQKKSEVAQEGDEIDIIKEQNPSNPNLLTVARVELLGANPKEEGYKVKLRRCKNLVVENYLK